MKRKNEKGFTIIELMVVILIMGILATIAIPKVFAYVAKSKVAEGPQVLASWARLQETYFMDQAKVGSFDDIGFKDPSAQSKYFKYTQVATNGGGVSAKIIATLQKAAGECAANDVWSRQVEPLGGELKTTWGYPTGAGGVGTNNQTECALLTPNFGS